jgi:predicted ATP-dependent protease
MIAINTEGEQVGQMNALVVYDFGIYSFGKPTRVSCQVRLGNGRLTDIEREVKLGGPIHTKGVLILSSFLSSRFAQKQPISLDGSLVFEQSYSEVDGDSASVAELACLLSAISDIPIKQSIAVTGAVNQLGEVQAVGAVNEKIEGFFDVCKMNGLTGKQGVIIPASTKPNLMLSPEVVEAVKQKKFHIYAVNHIDEAMEILTGKPFGTGKDGKYTPKGSISERIALRLNEYFQTQQKLKK